MSGVDDNRQQPAAVTELRMPRNFTFFGCYDHTIDSKGRLIIPTAFRKPLGEKFVIGVTPDGEAIALYPQEVFAEMMFDLYQLNRLSIPLQKHLTNIGRTSFPNMEADTQGRVLIPAKLRQRFLGDAKELEISGAMDHVRIVTAAKGVEEDEYFDRNRLEILQSVSQLKADLMARKGEA